MRRGIGSGVQDFRAAADKAERLMDRLHVLLSRIEQAGLTVEIKATTITIKVAKP